MWWRFPKGVDWVLQQQGFELTTGFDAVSSATRHLIWDR